MTQSRPLSIDLKDVTKTYRGGVFALRGVSLQVHPGEIFGLQPKGLKPGSDGLDLKPGSGSQDLEAKIWQPGSGSKHLVAQIW